MITDGNTGQASQLSPISPWTFSYNNDGNNLTIAIEDYSGNFVTGITYNGVSMTPTVARQEVFGNLSTVRLFELLNAAQGSNTVAVSFTDSPILLIAVCASYSSAESADNSNSSEINAANITGSVALGISNSWALMAVVVDTFGNPTAGTGSFLRKADTTYGALSLFDSNGAQSIGTYSMTINSSGGGERMIEVIESLPPSVVAATTKQLATLGVG